MVSILFLEGALFQQEKNNNNILMYIDIIPNFKTFDTIQPILKNVNASGGNRGVMNKKVQLHDF